MRRRTMTTLAMVAVLLVGTVLATPAATSATPPAPGDVFDDFELPEGPSAWTFFGGDNGGGGGAIAVDRPKQGSGYLSTGWGGTGGGGFYGVMLRNLDNAAQVDLPDEPWLNVWVLNQSDASADSYTLEITVREDLNADGVDAGDDSFRLDTTFASSAFDDEWSILSAPLSSFTDLDANGDGVIDGDSNIDEIVIVIASVQGADGSTVEVDFDQLTFTSGGPAAFDEVVFDDMEHGNPTPGSNGWFVFSGAGGGGFGPNTGDLPPANGGTTSLEFGWGTGGASGFYGGFGRTFPSDISGTEYFNFWINPNADQEYTLEINLQDDDNGDDSAVGPQGPGGDDDEFRYNCVVSPSGPCAIAGGGWQLVSIPLADFFDNNSLFDGGNGILDPTPAARGGNGQLINTVFAVVGTGSDVNFRTDYWTFTTEPPGAPTPTTVIDDFENDVGLGLPCPAPSAALPLGFCTFNDNDSTVSISTTSTPPAPVPGAASGNNVLSVDTFVDSNNGFAGVIHGFADTQNWSTSEGFSFWLYGNNTNSTLFVDILDNVAPGSTADTAERFSIDIVDDFSGWQFFEIPFTSFGRKEVGNGAPNDGFTLTEIHGWAFGVFASGQVFTNYLDDVSVYGTAEPPALAVNLSTQNTFIEEGTTGNVGVKLNRPLGPDDPAQVSIDFATERSNAIPGEEFTPTSGTLTFTKDEGATELFFPVETFDDTKFEGDEQIVIRLTNPVDVERGALFQGSVLIDDNDPFDPDRLDDFEQGSFLWDTEGPADLEAVRTEIGDPDERPGQDAVENVGVAVVPRHVNIAVQGNLCGGVNGVVPVHLLSTTTFDATTVDHTTVGFGGATETHVKKKTGVPERHVDDVNGDGLDDLVFHFRRGEADLCGAGLLPFNGETFDGQPITAGGSDAALVRDFPIGQDWTGTETLDFWYYGAGGGEEITVGLKNNRAPDPGPTGWELAWADEFDDPAGTPPNQANWAYELGDTTPDGKNGWGNEELQYYTDDPANAQTDGAGNLVITLDEADGSQECYYGPCEFESARLITQNKAEFAYGRIESRIQVPTGGDGLWPAFWSLGTDITYNPWPGAGEIDVMEYISREPTEIFGTIHGPGYNGGGAFGNIYDFGERVDLGYHTFTVEWEPNLITWYVDGIQYHEAEPSSPGVTGPWVFEKPFFLLLNFAIGGNFGGAIDPDNTYPQEYLVDYVRVYQGPDTAERFEATFTDAVQGWQPVSIPMTSFTRSEEQPEGAPNDGLNLDEVWGYSLGFPTGTASGEARIDLVELVPIPPPTELVVTTPADSGPGSLREALGLIADGGTITFDPGLAGSTIALTSGQLVSNRSVTIDASATPGIVVSGSNTSRVFQIGSSATVSMNDLGIADGAGSGQGGGILNFGTLSLDRVVVADNTETDPAPPDPGLFNLGGGGVYNGEGATLNLTDSTVSGNTSLNHNGGGVYSSFNTTTNVTRSTISGNVGGDVAGGLRSLGAATIVNSTISGNTSTGWHGGALFATDGTVTISNSTIVGNNSPGGTAGGLMVATFGAPVNVTIEDNIIADNGTYNCQIEGGGAAALTSLGGNVNTDPSCSLIGTDQDVGPAGALVDALADNGGPTRTHALLAGSPAIDAAVGTCPATDQRGVARPQGAGCDVGAFESTP